MCPEKCPLSGRQGEIRIRLIIYQVQYIIFVLRSLTSMEFYRFASSSWAWLLPYCDVHGINNQEILLKKGQQKTS